MHVGRFEAFRLHVLLSSGACIPVKNRQQTLLINGGRLGVRYVLNQSISNGLQELNVLIQFLRRVVFHGRTLSHGFSDYDDVTRAHLTPIQTTF